MAAGLGFKTFAVGEVLSAANVNGYLMQGVLVFADAAARDAAITSPQEGQFAYLKDTNVTTYYTGSAWANLDTTGMTNPMTTTGDTIYSSSGSTPARLGIGTTGQVLTVAGGVPSWATPAAGGGGKVLQVVQSLTTGYIATTSTSYTDANLSATITPTSATSKILIMITQAVRFYTSTAATPAAADMTILRNSTAVWNTAQTQPYVGEFEIAGGGQAIQAVVNYLDSPATTSAITYKPQYRLPSNTNSRTLYFNYGGNQSNIILMEIGA
jgi:hypothetical protein